MIESPRIDAVLPLRLADAERFKRLFHPSLVRYGTDLVSQCFLIVPEDDHDAMVDLCPAGPYRILREAEVAPQLSTMELRGWFKQQLLKLAVVDWVSTSHYLVLDADVIFTRAVRYEDISRDGRTWFYSSPTGSHDQWHRWSAEVLQRPWDGRHYAVTPTIWASDGVRRLLAHLASSLLPDPRPLRLCATDVLLARLPWTEHTLYGIYMASEGLLETYHWLRANALYGNSVWHSEDFRLWDPERSFGRGDCCFFSVVQSSAGITVDAMIERVGSYLN